MRKTLWSVIAGAALVAAPLVAVNAAESAGYIATQEGEEAGAGVLTYVTPLLALTAVVLGVVAASSSNSNDAPVSP